MSASLLELHRPATLAAPWSFYANLRRTAPIHRDPALGCWLLTRHADVTYVLGHPAFSVAMDHTARAARLPEHEAGLRRTLELLDLHVSFVDAPDHDRLRGALADPLRPVHVRALEDVVARLVAVAVTDVRATGAPDLVEGLAARVPLEVIRALLGLEDVPLTTLRRWSNAWGDVVAAPGHLPTGDRARLMADVAELITRLRALVAAPRAGTVTDHLVGVHVAGGLTGEELLANLMMLLTAGNETTGNLIANALLALVEEPERWAELRDDRSLIGVAVEELARLHTPTQYTARTALEDVTIGSATVARGETVVLLLAAANRDPEVFPAPGTLRFDRPNVRRHVAFGHGSHFCFGAPLARLEVRLVLDALLEGPRPELDGPPTWRMNANLRGLATLPVRWPAPVEVTT